VDGAGRPAKAISAARTAIARASDSLIVIARLDLQYPQWSASLRSGDAELPV
jgi:hypothetical protein